MMKLPLLAALLVLAEEDPAQERLRRVYPSLPSKVRRWLGPLEEIPVADALREGGVAEYDVRAGRVVLHRASLRHPFLTDADVAAALTHEAHHKEFHRRMTARYGWTNDRFVRWMNTRRDRIEVGAYRAPGRFGISTLHRPVFSRDTAGKPLFVEVPFRPEAERILEVVAAENDIELQRILRKTEDPALRELASRGEKFLRVQSLLVAGNAPALATLAKEPGDPVLREFSRAGIAVLRTYESAGRRGLWTIAENDSRDPLLRETANAGLRRLPNRLWLHTQRFGYGFSVFAAGIMGAQAMGALAFGGWDQFRKHTKEMIGWEFLRDYAAFSVGASGGTALYRLGGGALPRWGWVHHVAGRSAPLALGLAMMDAVRGELDPFLLAFSIVSLEMGSWMTELELTVLGPLLRRIPRVPVPAAARVALVPLARALGLAPPAGPPGWAAQVGHLALTLFNAGLITHGVAAGLERGQQVAEEDEIREEMTVALRGFETGISPPSARKVSTAFERYRDGLVRRESRKDEEARKRFVDAVCATDLDRTATYEEILTIDNPKERSFLLERLVRPTHADRRKSYDIQIGLYYKAMPFAKDEASKRFLRSEIDRLSEATLREEEILSGKRPTGGVIEKLRAAGS